jgi:hypothetical protein
VPTATGLVTVASWPEDAALSGDVVRVPVAGGGVVLVAGVRRWGDGEHAVLRETAVWLGMAARVSRLRADHARAQARASGLRAEVTAARERLAQVRDLERRRLVGAITTTTLRDLADVRVRLRGLADGASPDELTVVRAALDDLLDNFRTVVRGVYPAMLPDRGPRAALEELAATLPRPVRFTGDLGRRVGWQIESGLYHAVAAVLNVLAGMETDQPIDVDFGRDEVLRVRITAAADRLSVRELCTTLGHDAERLAVLGGAMECAVTDGAAVVNVRVAERIEPAGHADGAPPLEHSALYRRVRDLVRQGQEAAGGDRARWDAVAARMTAPPRLAVVSDTGSPIPDRLAVPGVTVIVVDRPADRTLAEEFLADGGPRGAVDAVLCLVPPAPAFRAALRWGRQRVELTEAGSAEVLARKLVAWRPVIAARRAIVSVTELVRSLPQDHPLRWAVDRIGVEAHEITELDLLDDLERGDARLLRGMTVDAARLLGANGTGARARLGMTEDADDGQVRAAAEQVARRWRTHAEHPATGGRDRMACDVLVRTAEGMLTTVRGGEGGAGHPVTTARTP